MNVSIDRDNCTSCRTCEETCPAFFDMNPDDSFSQVVEKYRASGDPGKGVVPADLEDCVKEAADLCPVQIIAIEA